MSIAFDRELGELEIACDKCGNVECYHEHDFKSCIELAKAEGWQVKYTPDELEPYHHFCPDCNERNPKNVF